MYRALFVVVCLLLLALAIRPDTSIANNPLQEDGYYALTVARNIGLGHGCTIDGTHATTGFQPLVTILSSACFVLSGGERIMGLRYYLVFSAFVCFAGALLFRRLMCWLVKQPLNADQSWAFAAVYSTSLYMFTLHTNGLETGLLLVGYLLLWQMIFHWPTEPTASHYARLATVMSMLILTRIDVLVPASVVFIGMVLRSPRTHRIHLMVAAIAVLLSVVPWFWYVHSVTGSLMPSGGTAQSSMFFSTERITQATYNTLEALAPYMFLRFHWLSEWWGELLRLGVIILLAKPLLGQARSISATMLFQQRNMARYLVGGLVLLMTFYLATSFATWHYTRYFAPVSIILIALFYAAIVRRGNRWLQGAVLAQSALFLLFYGALVSGRGTGNEMINHQLALVRQHVPDSIAVASSQTGTLGFMRSNVLNMDGKVNIDAIRNRHRIDAYLAEQSVRWYCDEPELINQFLGLDYEKHGWRITAQKGNFVLLHR